MSPSLAAAASRRRERKMKSKSSTPPSTTAPLLLLFLFFLVLASSTAAAASLWPLPSKMTSTGSTLELDGALFSFAVTGSDSDLLRRAFDRYDGIVFRTPAYYSSSARGDDKKKEGKTAATQKDRDADDDDAPQLIERLEVSVSSTDQSLSVATDESYELVVDAPFSRIKAPTVFGALRALETFAQLVERVDGDGGGGGSSGTRKEKEEEEADDEEKDGGDEDDDGEEEEELARRHGHRHRHCNDDDDDDDDERRHRHHHRHHHHRRHHHKKRKREHKHKKRRDVGDSRFFVPAASVSDAPRFAHRGTLIDSARHFLPLDVIVTHLDAMEASKLNVLHWHLSDDQAFSVSLPGAPELAAKGGALGGRLIYSRDDVASVVVAARERGIRVIPELDAPAHSGSWSKGAPEGAMMPCYDERTGRPLEGEGAPPPLMDPSSDAAYDVLWRALRGAAELFPDAKLHVGGDEMDLGCWRGSARVREWAEKQAKRMQSPAVVSDDNPVSNRDPIEQAFAAFVSRAVGMAAAAGRAAVVWQEAFEAGADLPPTAEVEVWKWWDGSGGPPSGDDATTAAAERAWRGALAAATAAGHRAILAAPWFLNLGRRGHADWEEMYAVDPTEGMKGGRSWRGGRGGDKGNATTASEAASGLAVSRKRRSLLLRSEEDENGDELPAAASPSPPAAVSWGPPQGVASLVIGGEACLWGEMVDGTNLLSVAWPRAAAVAERLWSQGGDGGGGDASSSSSLPPSSLFEVDEDTRERMRVHRCRLVARGVPASPVGPFECPFE